MKFPPLPCYLIPIKKYHIVNLMKIRPVEAELFHEHGQTGSETWKSW
jgi:hypothetical protein